MNKQRIKEMNIEMKSGMKRETPYLNAECQLVNSVTNPLTATQLDVVAS